MATARTIRNWTIALTVVALLVSGAVILRDAFAPVVTGDVRGLAFAERVQVDLKAVEELVADERFRALVPLAPDLRATRRGNPNPFLIFEDR